MSDIISSKIDLEKIGYVKFSILYAILKEEVYVYDPANSSLRVPVFNASQLYRFVEMLKNKIPNLSEELFTNLYVSAMLDEGNLGVHRTTALQRYIESAMYWYYNEYNVIWK